MRQRWNVNNLISDFEDPRPLKQYQRTKIWWEKDKKHAAANVANVGGEESFHL